MKRVAVYAGSFDPPTNGHLWMIQQGAKIFDELVVVLAANPDKKGLFSMEQRRIAMAALLEEVPGNVRLATMTNGFLVDFALGIGAQYLLRGIRNTVDFEYEKSMARMNGRMEPALRTVFLMPPSELEEISSSFVRGFVGQPDSERWVQACVPPSVFRLICSHASSENSSGMF